MEVSTPATPKTRTLIGVLLLVGATLTATLTLLLPPEPAYANQTTSCGQAVCYVSTTVRVESDWDTHPYISQDGSVVYGSVPPLFITTTKICNWWTPSTVGYTVSSYPVQNSNQMWCGFSDSGSFGGGATSIEFFCPPLSDRASNGRVDYFVQQVQPDGSTKWVFARFRCLYPIDIHAPIERLQGTGKVYTGGQATFRQVSSYTRASTPGTDGTITSSSGYITRTVNLNNPKAYTGAWQPAFTAQTGNHPNGAPLYGYYRLLWELDYRLCQEWSYPAWLNQPTRYDCSTTGRDTPVQGYTYACNTTPPLQAGRTAGAIFDPSLCSPNWSCEVNGQLTINGNRDNLTVMRNGETLNITNPTLTADGDVQNPRSWVVNNTINPGSTPFNGTNPNAPNQYFKASFRWGQDTTLRTAEQIAFYWASKDTTSGFSWTQRYAFTGDFYVPQQTTPGGATVWSWVPDRAVCSETHNSPVITVVRAVNSPTT